MLIQFLGPYRQPMDKKDFQRYRLPCILHFVQILILLAPCSACFRLPPKYGGQEKQTAPSKMTVGGKWLRDTRGRVRLFHGINAVQKALPWYPEHLLNDTKLDLYRSWGFNVVRLGTMWSGLEPTEGYVNSTYMSIMKTIVRKLSERGIHVILDLHQDVLSSEFGTYDGIPRWLMKKLPPSPHPYPWPLPTNGSLPWASGYLTQAASRAFQAIYSNTSGATHHLCRFWSIVAENLGSYSNVLGYELMNEPWAGDIYSDPSLLLPGQAGFRNLAPLYDRLNQVIRQVDESSLLFYEPVTWGIYLNGVSTGTGFQSVPGGQHYRDKAVLSYHYYCWLLSHDSVIAKNYGSSLYRQICDKVLGTEIFKVINTDIERTGGSSFLTEFGNCQPDGNPNSTDTVECEFVLNQADRNLQSWTYWDSEFFDKDGHIRVQTLLPFSRPTPWATAGEPLDMRFNLTSLHFIFSFRLDPLIDDATEIFVPRVHYPKGVAVTVPSGITWEYQRRKSLLEIKKAYPIKDSRKVTITMKPLP